MAEHTTAGEAIRLFCKKCTNSVQTKVIQDCGGEMVLATKKPCALFKYRLKGRGTVKAIRRNCVDCMGGSFNAVDDCQTKDCDLYPYRMGRSLSKTRGIGRPFISQNQFKQVEAIGTGFKSI